MEKDHSIINDNQNNDYNPDAVMNRVNQTFEQMVQDVRNMIDENNQQSDNQLS